MGGASLASFETPPAFGCLMANSPTEVKKIGLVYIGVTEDDDKANRAANTVYDRAVGIVSELFNWKFFKTRAELAVVADANGEVTPVCGYAHQFELPTNCKRIVAFVDEDGDDIEYEYRKEFVKVGDNEYDVILTDETTCFVKYIAVRLDPAKWPDAFSHLVSVQIALMICEPLKQDKQKLNQLALIYGQVRNDAEIFNAAEDQNVDSDGVPLDAGKDDVVEASSVDEADKTYIRSE